MEGHIIHDSTHCLFQIHYETVILKCQKHSVVRLYNVFSHMQINFIVPSHLIQLLC
jgi:hypothetical protein